MAKHWFDELKRIWLAKDISSVGSLLSEKFEYYEYPFEPPLTSLQDVEKAWEGVNDEEISELDIQTLIEKENEGFAYYSLAYKDPSGIMHKSRGAYYVKLDSNGKATEFRRWWVSK